MALGENMTKGSSPRSRTKRTVYIVFVYFDVIHENNR
jgi:hypothetical protein